MKPAYTAPEKLARAAFRVITARIAHGYWPYAYAMQKPVGDLRTGDWAVYVTIKREQQVRPSDQFAYVFEYRCVDEKVARDAVAKLHTMFFTGNQKVEISGRTGRMEPIASIIKRVK